MAKAAAETGAGPTVLVAIEQYFPKRERIIDDDLAGKILPSGRALLPIAKSSLIRNWMIRVSEKNTPGMWGCMVCRKRYIDEKVRESHNEIEAVVNLGAGYDTRALRLQELSEIPVWELDQPETVESKRSRICKIFGGIPPHVHLTAIDFDHEKLENALESSGYSLNKRTFFIWEAVTQYLTQEGVRATFDFLSKAERGSRLALTYVRQDFLDGRAKYGWEGFYKKFVEKNKTWIFGMEPEAWPNFLKAYGWRIIEEIGYDKLAERYVKPTGRTLASTPIERIVYAEKL